MSRGNDVCDYFFPAAHLQFNRISYRSKDPMIIDRSFSGDLHGSYRKKFGKHSIDLTGVYEYNNLSNDGFSVLAEGFFIPELLNNNLGTVDAGAYQWYYFV